MDTKYEIGFIHLTPRKANVDKDVSITTAMIRPPNHKENENVGSGANGNRSRIECTRGFQYDRKSVRVSSATCTAKATQSVIHAVPHCRPLDVEELCVTKPQPPSRSTARLQTPSP
jgi:hypothetical protein